MKHGYIQYSNINNIINHMYMYAYNVYDFLFENQSQFYIYYTKNKLNDTSYNDKASYSYITYFSSLHNKCRDTGIKITYEIFIYQID